uniref:Uncharacterized protein n=1 Tax=Anguilla anguilla TaxID=7936 RepID=A0A0E9R1P2_ANGAN
MSFSHRTALINRDCPPCGASERTSLIGLL